MGYDLVSGDILERKSQRAFTGSFRLRLDNITFPFLGHSSHGDLRQEIKKIYHRDYLKLNRESPLFRRLQAGECCLQCDSLIETITSLNLRRTRFLSKLV